MIVHFISLCVLGSLKLFYIDASCTFPNDLRGVWISLYNGPMIFGDSTISGYNTSIQNTHKLHLDCMEGNSTYFILRSSQVLTVFNQDIHLYLCLEIEQQSENIYQHHIRTDYQQILKEYIQGHPKNQELGEVCVIGTDQPILLVRNESLYLGSIGSLCPSLLQGYYVNLTVNGKQNKVCRNGFLDARKVYTQFGFNIENMCVNDFGNMIFTCLNFIQDNDNNYLYVWTDNDNLQTVSSFGFFCMIITKTDSNLGIEIFPETCNMTNNSILDIQFAILQDMTTTERAQEKKAGALLSTPVVAVIVVVVCVIIGCMIAFVIHWQRKKLGLNCHMQQDKSNNFDDIK